MKILSFESQELVANSEVADRSYFLNDTTDPGIEQIPRWLTFYPTVQGIRLVFSESILLFHFTQFLRITVDSG